jgi:hypothetical protein
MRQTKHQPQKLDDLSARALVVLAALNVNGVVFMAFGIGQAISMVMLAFCAALIGRHGSLGVSTPMKLLCAAIIAYLVLGSAFLNPLEGGELEGNIWLSNIGTIMLVWSIASYTSLLGDGPKLLSLLRFVRTTFVFSAASVLASPVLYQYFVNLPPSSAQRMGGFFGNPNEAGMASACALALVLSRPYRNNLMHAAALGITTLAIIATFSKAAMTAAVLIALVHVLRRINGVMRLLVPLLALASLVVMYDAKRIVDEIVNADVLSLDEHQKNRLLAVGKILAGELNEDTTTGRSELWGITIERAIDIFPSGSGIGSRHFIIGGVLEGDVWQGVHNTFLLFLGEAGPLPAVLLLFGIGSIFYAAAKAQRGDLEFAFLFLLFFDMMSTHTALVTRFENLTLGLTLGLVSFAARANGQPQNLNTRSDTPARLGREFKGHGWLCFIP